MALVDLPLLLCTIRPMSGNPDSEIRKIFVAGILRFGIQKIAQENENLTNDWNSESNSTDKDWNTWNPEQSAAWNAEFKTDLDFLIRGKPLITHFSLFSVISNFLFKMFVTSHVLCS